MQINSNHVWKEWNGLGALFRSSGSLWGAGDVDPPNLLLQVLEKAIQAHPAQGAAGFRASDRETEPGKLEWARGEVWEHPTGKSQQNSALTLFPLSSRESKALLVCQAHQ